MASSRFNVDKPPADELHSFPRRVTLRVALGGQQATTTTTTTLYLLIIFLQL